MKITANFAYYISSLCALLLHVTLAHAATTSQVVDSVSAQGTTFFVYFSNSFTGGPSCATQTKRFAINSTLPGGAAMVAVILAAYGTGAVLFVQGDGTCSAWPDTETIDYAIANKP